MRSPARSSGSPRGEHLPEQASRLDGPDLRSTGCSDNTPADTRDWRATFFRFPQSTFSFWHASIWPITSAKMPGEMMTAHDRVLSNRLFGVRQSESAEITSPPARVEIARKVGRLTLSLTNWTCPSSISMFTPPG